jgi:putative oxidoreductase
MAHAQRNQDSSSIGPVGLSKRILPNNEYDAFNVSLTGTRISIDRLLLVSARVLLAFIFVFSGVMKIFAWNQTLSYMTSKGMPVPGLLLLGATLIEIICGLLVAFGRHVRLSSGLLFLYLIPTTLIFHNFWTLEGMEAQNQMTHFLKNLAIMGGLLTLFNLDRFSSPPEASAHGANLKGQDF